MKNPKYIKVLDFIKNKIQLGEIEVGGYLPSENELCLHFSVTRTTVRKALDELLKEGFIEKQHGKGSRVRERRKSLGLLTVKGFSEAVGENAQTVFIQKPVVSDWGIEINHEVNESDKSCQCIYFERLRKVNDEPVMIEKNWMSGKALEGFLNMEFTEGSFFKTLSRVYRIEITGSEHELRAGFANAKTNSLLNIKKGIPVLRISVKFTTSNPQLTIYSELFCNTEKYPVGNSYFI